MALWGAFVIETLAGKIYHIGDTGFHHQGINYKAAAEKHGSFRLAILPIGAYEPRWFMQGQHQNPKKRSPECSWPTLPMPLATTGAPLN